MNRRAIINIKSCEACPFITWDSDIDGEYLWCASEKTFHSVIDDRSFDYKNEVAPWCPYLVKHVLDGGK